MTAIVELKNATKVITNGFDEEKIILNDVSLEIFERRYSILLERGNFYLIFSR